MGPMARIHPLPWDSQTKRRLRRSSSNRWLIFSPFPMRTTLIPFLGHVRPPYEVRFYVRSLRGFLQQICIYIYIDKHERWPWLTPNSAEGFACHEYFITRNHMKPLQGESAELDSSVTPRWSKQIQANCENTMNKGPLVDGSSWLGSSYWYNKGPLVYGMNKGPLVDGSQRWETVTIHAPRGKLIAEAANVIELRYKALCNIVHRHVALGRAETVEPPRDDCHQPRNVNWPLLWESKAFYNMKGWEKPCSTVGPTSLHGANEMHSEVARRGL